MAETPTNACGHIYKYVDQTGSAALLASIQSAGVTPGGESEDHTGKKAHKGLTLALKPSYIGVNRPQAEFVTVSILFFK